MKKFLISLAIIISVISVLAVGGVFYVLSRGDYDHHIVSRVLDKIDDEVNLSGEQSTRIEAALNDAVKRFRKTRQESITALLTQPTLTTEQVRQAMDTHRPGSAREHRDALIADTVVSIHQILTPTQRTDLAEVLDEMREEFTHHRGRRHHRERWQRWWWW